MIITAWRNARIASSVRLRRCKAGPRIRTPSLWPLGASPIVELVKKSFSRAEDHPGASERRLERVVKLDVFRRKRRKRMFGGLQLGVR